MSRFVAGSDRDQMFLLPPSLEDYVGDDSPVRVVDAYVEEVDLREWGFARIAGKASCRPSYHSATHESGH
ncbi:hypothetical protein [Parasphingorhabdus sp.]|jgi:transposase|uniref:hypothetical protein n=1 Tax=Parasphingorhabdus sp. TaxID=2709688 RepID=UPI0007F33A02|nr:hypothetical protein A8B75_10775 [Sphingomonadales bacterium EhC05]